VSLSLSLPSLSLFAATMSWSAGLSPREDSVCLYTPRSSMLWARPLVAHIGEPSRTCLVRMTRNHALVYITCGLFYCSSSDLVST
jgi:hypothetical protein